jgi:hypothetical protein
MKIGEEIKVHIVQNGKGRESLWAEYLGDNKVKILNIPFVVNTINLYDIVEINDEKKITGVISSTMKTYYIKWEPSLLAEEIKFQWKQICEYLNKNDKIHKESAYAGFFSIAVPNKIRKQRFFDFLQKSPVKLTIME